MRRNTELVSIPYEWKERFLARIETWETEALERNQQHIDYIKNDLSMLQTKIDRVNTGSADGGLNIQEFKEIKNELVSRKVELEQQFEILEKRRTNRFEP